MVWRFLFLMWVATAALVAGCGGGSDGTSTGTAPAITTQPTSQTATAGTSVSFAVVASGTATLTYQWRKGGTAISGATAATYTLGAVATGDAGSYDVVVSNSQGSVTSSAATLTVTSTSTAPSITTQPASLTVALGASANFTVVASGSATLSYQWRKDGSAISGATAASYSIAAVTSGDVGSYDVVVGNSQGSVSSSAATLTVIASSSAPAITTQPTSQSVVAGTNVSFSVAATGSSPLSYQWRKGGAAISGATASSYTLSAVTAADAGSYDVVVSNAVGSATSSAATLAVTTATSSALSSTVYTTAMAFYNTLSASQQSTVQLAWSVDTARKWSNLPAQLVARNGITWGSLSTAQQTAARALIASALSSTGNALHVGMQAADDYLAANGGGSSYGNAQYYIAFLGTPSASGFWMLQLSGHHLTYNIAFNGSYKSPTPLFLGIEPKGSFTQSGTTYDPMLAQRTAMSNLGASLTSYAGAKLSGTYGDLLFGANGSGNIDGTCPRAYSTGVTEHGLLYSSLSASDQALVQAAINAYVNTQATEYAADLLSAYLGNTALAATYVAYSGSGTVTTNGNYFRIEGPRVWIEFSVQKGVIFSSDIHFHTIWRDKVGDYGGKCIS